jgi:hypothetical protein
MNRQMRLAFPSARASDISRLDQDWECWAIFADRICHIPGMPGIPETIFLYDPDLLEVASIFRLTIETVEGFGQYYRP